MSTRLQTAIDDRVAEVVLNRPEKHNAVDLAMFDELGELGASLGSDRSVRAVVLRGSGANFCAGIDLDIFGSSDAAIGAKTWRRWREHPLIDFSVLRTCGGNCPFRSSARSRVWHTAPACRLHWVRICVTGRPTRNCR